MSITDTYEDTVNRSLGKTYTFSEAIEFQKFLDRNFPTNYAPLNWRNVKTGKPVIIGYTRN